MSKVTVNNRHQKVIRHKDRTEVWGKDSAGCTRKSLHSNYHHKSGNTTNHYGKITSTGGRSGRTKSKR